MRIASWLPPRMFAVSYLAACVEHVRRAHGHAPVIDAPVPRSDESSERYAGPAQIAGRSYGLAVTAEVPLATERGDGALVGRQPRAGG